MEGRPKRKKDETMNVCKDLPNWYYDIVNSGRGANNFEDLISDFLLPHVFEIMKENEELIPGKINMLFAGSAHNLNPVYAAALLSRVGLDAKGNKIIFSDINIEPMSFQKEVSKELRKEIPDLESDIFMTVMDARNLAIDSNSIDILISDFTINFCQDAECIEKSISEISRVLKDTGKCFLHIGIIIGNDFSDNIVKPDGLIGFCPSWEYLRGLFDKYGLTYSLVKRVRRRSTVDLSLSVTKK